jgi:hypothetical protein
VVSVAMKWLGPCIEHLVDESVAGGDTVLDAGGARLAAGFCWHGRVCDLASAVVVL